jgi:DNA-binding PucR family transcriptional regulator
VGCSSETHGVDGPGIAVRQAEEALRRAATAGSPCFHDELSRGLRLIDDQPSERLQAIAMSLVEPLRRYDAEHRTYLLTTLKALFDNGLSANQTAATLFVHRNTLRKRLRRIEAVLGVDLTDMDDIAELYLALRADELLGSHA